MCTTFIIIFHTFVNPDFILRNHIVHYLKNYSHFNCWKCFGHLTSKLDECMQTSNCIFAFSYFRNEYFIVMPRFSYYFCGAFFLWAPRISFKISMSLFTKDFFESIDQYFSIYQKNLNVSMNVWKYFCYRFEIQFKCPLAMCGEKQNVAFSHIAFSFSHFLICLLYLGLSCFC